MDMPGMGTPALALRCIPVPALPRLLTLPLPARPHPPPPLQELLAEPDMQTVLTCGAMSKAPQPGAANAIDPDHLVSPPSLRAAWLGLPSKSRCSCAAVFSSALPA